MFFNVFMVGFALVFMVSYAALSSERVQRAMAPMPVSPAALAAICAALWPIVVALLLNGLYDDFRRPKR
jgi:hypothetical protein